jgi:hypothetical protein
VNNQVAGKKPVTVVSFGNASLQLTRGGTYGIVGNDFTVTDPAHPHAVDYSAQATVQPAGVNCSAPQLANIRVGFMQESSNYSDSFIYANPTVTFLSTAPHNKHVVVPVTISDTHTYAPAVLQPVNDGEDIPLNSFPLYGIDPGETAIPIGCPGGAAAISFDTPDTPFKPTFSLPARATEDGTIVGTTMWQTLVHVTRTEHFRTYCVIFDATSAASRGASFCALRQATWDLNIDSANPNQQATVSPDAPATANPVARLPIANNAPEASTQTPVGTATMTFPTP